PLSGAVAARAQSPPAGTHTTVTDQMLSNAAADAKNWLSYGKDYGNTRYTRSKKITSQNVGALVPRWVYQTGGPIGSFETTPLVVDGVMYVTTDRKSTRLNFSYLGTSSAVFCS